MELKTSDILLTIECDLGRYCPKRYTVSQFCQSAKLSRASFYRHYRDINSIFAEYISFNFYAIFDSPKYKTEKTKYKLFIEHLMQNHEIYQNIYQLSSERLFVNKVLIDLFKPVIAKKYNTSGLISDEALSMLAKSISGIFLEWIDEGFSKSEEEILDHIERIIAVAENVQKLL